MPGGVRGGREVSPYSIVPIRRAALLVLRSIGYLGDLTLRRISVPKLVLCLFIAAGLKLESPSMSLWLVMGNSSDEERPKDRPLDCC